MKIIKNIVISGKHQKPIVTDLFYTDDNKPKPIVIFAHGYKGYKDWGCWNLAAEAFAKQRFFFVKFNFSHNGGTVGQPIDFPDLEAFGHNNFIKELDDLQSVINWILTEKSIQHNIEPANITLIGHSRGGGIVSIKASEDKRITNLITWAGVSDYGARFPTGEILENWRKNGVSYIENSRTKQQMPHYFQFYENYIENKQRLHIENAVKKLTIPHLIVHGSNDETVSIKEAENLHLWNPKSKLHIVKNANHTFGAAHPWKENSLPDAMKQVVAASLDFLA